ncbi:hypothetical protein [Paraglaciecola sp. 2405UD69-4]|uniref:hypothetical protein n=1 Tax=Paraglaciecola sp. 2405UD69-4 TaxID=3391836 RepID=UPI0039C92AF9
MTDIIRAPHYAYSDEMKARFKREPEATVEAFSRRASAFSLLESLAANPVNPSLVSSTYGGIDAILMTLPGYVFSYSSYSDPISDLIGKLPSQCHLFILVSQNHRTILDTWLQNANATSRTTVVEAPTTMQFTVWAEDAYAVVSDTAQSPATRHLVEPATFRRAHDSLIADEMAKGSSLNQSQVQLYFQGGNLLIGDDFWLMGMDYAINSLNLGYVVPQAGETELQAIERAYGEALDQQKKLILVGSSLAVPAQKEIPIVINNEPWTEEVYAGNSPGTTQPLFHIDMFITLLGRSESGRQRALVGDPKMAADILGIPTSPYAMQSVFDDIAGKLEANGFEVERNPLPLTYQDDPSRKKRYWYFATANNALVQTSQGDEQVWIPTYGHGAWPELSATDDANAQIWRNLGYTVNRLGDFHPFAFNLGAAHCITKFLGRS